MHPLAGANNVATSPLRLVWLSRSERSERKLESADASASPERTLLPRSESAPVMLRGGAKPVSRVVLDGGGRQWRRPNAPVASAADMPS